MTSTNHGELVIFLQEVSQVLAQQLMRIKWVQDNFIVIGHEPPRAFHAGIPRQARYYTMAMAPRSLRLQNSFRMPLPSEIEQSSCSTKSGKKVLIACICKYAVPRVMPWRTGFRFGIHFRKRANREFTGCAQFEAASA